MSHPRVPRPFICPLTYHPNLLPNCATTRPTRPFLSGDLCSRCTPPFCRLHFPVPPPDAKLGQLRQEIAEYTQLPAHSFKLIHAGAVMKDDNAPGTYVSPVE